MTSVLNFSGSSRLVFFLFYLKYFNIVVGPLFFFIAHFSTKIRRPEGND